MRKGILIWVLSLTLFSCGGDPLDDSGYFSDFVINNDSDYVLTINYSLPNAGPGTYETIEVEVGATTTFYTEFAMTNNISAAPSPESAFTQITVSILRSGNQITSEDKQSDENWVRAIDERVTYTLTVLNSDFE